MEKVNSNRYPQKPKVIGPFRGILVKFNGNINFDEFKETYAELTFLHPNFYRSENYKRRSIIYYRYPYDAATMIQKYLHNPNFEISIYYDDISKTLRPDILYIETKEFSKLNNMIKALQGTIIYQQQSGVQIKFKTFKQTSIAYEEMRKHFSVKFTYKTLVPEYEKQNNVNGVEESNCEPSTINQFSKLEQDISTMLKKYNGWTPILEKEFKKAFEEIKQKQNQVEQQTALVNPNGTTNEGSDDRKDFNKNITPNEVIIKLNSMYKEIQKEFN